MKQHNCPFCYTDSDLVWSEQPDNWYDVRRRLLGVRGNVSLCAGLGAIVQPYVIAFTREHFVAVAELDGANRSDLLDALDLCLSTDFFPSGSLTVFEHGGRSPENNTACLEHCHLHVIDSRHDLQLGLVDEYPEAQAVSVCESSNIVAEAGYLFTGEYAGDGIIRGLVVQKPSCGSQFFRRLLAAQVRSPEWNWRLSPSPESAFKLTKLWRQPAEALSV